MSKLFHWNLNWKLQTHRAMNFLKVNFVIRHFLAPYLPHDISPTCSNHAQQTISLFGSIYICEEFFSKMNIMKNSYRNQSKVERLAICLHAGTSQISRDTNISVTNTQHTFSFEVPSFFNNGEQQINKNKQNVIFMCPQFNLLRFHYKIDTRHK
jgi:hypothetical protein